MSSTLFQQVPNFGMPAPPAEAPKKPHLYIGNLSPRVTDQMLAEIFSVAGAVVSAKIIQDRNFQHGGFNYGFVEYTDMRSAEQALTTLNGRKIFDSEIRVNWAYQGQVNREDTQHHFHVFVGDLSPEVNDEVLANAFSALGSMSEARVMWDMNSGKSRGYGFLSFRDKSDAEQAIATMNGEWLGSRSIRVNWANQKTQTGGSRSIGLSGGAGGGPTAGGGFPPAAGPLTFEQIAAQTPEYNTTVYVGNLIPYTTQADLIPLFQSYGYIVEIRMQADRGFAFVKLDSHNNAALAISNLQNHLVHGRPIKCSWGKDRQTETLGFGAHAPQQPQQPHQHQQQNHQQHQQHQQAQHNQQPHFSQNYSYYPGYSGIPGQPGAQLAAPQHESGAGASAAQAAWDPAAASYYQTGWGGFYNGQNPHATPQANGAHGVNGANGGHQL